MENNIKILEKSLGYQFKNQNLIVEALTHKSYKAGYNNERMEFLGDAVLDLVVGEFLYHKFPNVDEGELSKMRASLVNERGFEKLSYLLNLGDFLFISTAEENNNGRTKSSLLSNSFEAVMGAIYLESNLKTLEKIVLRLLERAYPQIDLESIFKDYKTTLQELTQAEFGVTPDYKLVSASGPDHKKEFEMSVEVNGESLATANGKTKKEAQQKAAQKALDILKAKK